MNRERETESEKNPFADTQQHWRRWKTKNQKWKRKMLNVLNGKTCVRARLVRIYTKGNSKLNTKHSLAQTRYSFSTGKVLSCTLLMWTKALGSSSKRIWRKAKNDNIFFFCVFCNDHDVLSMATSGKSEQSFCSHNKIKLTPRCARHYWWRIYDGFSCCFCCFTFSHVFSFCLSKIHTICAIFSELLLVFSCRRQRSLPFHTLY